MTWYWRVWVMVAAERKAEEEEPPAKLLDDLFRKTKATPCIYWLPLTEEQVGVHTRARPHSHTEAPTLATITKASYTAFMVSQRGIICSRLRRHNFTSVYQLWACFICKNKAHCKAWPNAGIMPFWNMTLTGVRKIYLENVSKFLKLWIQGIQNN